MDNHDLIGNALMHGFGGWPGFPGGPFGLAVGQADSGPAMGPSGDPAAAMLAQQQYAQQALAQQAMSQLYYGGYPGGCFPCAPGAGIDPNLVASLVASKNSALIGWDGFTRGVDEFLGFECDVKICAGDTVDVQATPQIIFKAQRLIIPSTIGGQLVVRQLLVGNRPCFAGSGCIPGLAFAENSTYVKFNAETAWINQPITLTITNISDADLCFVATLVGKGANGGTPSLIG